MTQVTQHCHNDKFNLPCEFHAHLGVGVPIVVSPLPVGVGHDGAALEESQRDGRGVSLDASRNGDHSTQGVKTQIY